MPQPIATWNPARDVWETDQACIFGHWAEFSETWPASGMTLRGTALPLPASGRHTDGSESSSSPGRKAPLMSAKSTQQSAGTGDTTSSADSEISGGFLTTLPTPDARLLPTPTKSDGTGGPGNSGRDGGENLRTAVTYLPTPTARDWRSGQASPETMARNARPLSEVIETGPLLPTPRATDGTKGGPNQRGSSGDMMLPSAVVQLLPTPSACNPNDGETVETWEARRQATKDRVGNGNGFGTPLSIAVQLVEDLSE